MAIIVAAFSIMILGLSAWGIINPDALFAMVRRTTGKAFIYMAVGSRIFLAIILWLAAPVARHPIVFQVLAIVALVAAFVLLILGRDSALRLFNWFAVKSHSFQRAWLVGGLAFGGYLLWAIMPALGSG